MITAFTTNKYVFLLLVNIFLLIVGTFMETCAAILIVTPMFLPVCTSIGINPVAFGVIMVINLAIGFATPPLGLNLYAAASIRKRSVDYVINKYLWTYIAIAIVVLMLITNMETIIMFLPNLML